LVKKQDNMLSKLLILRSRVNNFNKGFFKKNHGILVAEIIGAI